MSQTDNFDDDYVKNEDDGIKKLYIYNKYISSKKQASMTYFAHEMLNTDFNIINNDILSLKNIRIKVKIKYKDVLRRIF